MTFFNQFHKEVTERKMRKRIATIADELERLCAVYEAQCRVGQKDVTHFDAEIKEIK